MLKFFIFFFFFDWTNLQFKSLQLLVKIVYNYQLSEMCDDGVGSGFQTNTNLDHNRKFHDTPVVLLRAHGVWVLLEYLLIFYDSKTHQRITKREGESDTWRAHEKRLCQRYKRQMSNLYSLLIQQVDKSRHLLNLTIKGIIY